MGLEGLLQPLQRLGSSPRLANKTHCILRAIAESRPTLGCGSLVLPCAALSSTHSPPGRGNGQTAMGRHPCAL